MKNVWKGLTVGAFAGAAVGVMLDGLHRAGDASSRALHKAGDASARAASEVSARAKSGAIHLAEVVEEKIDDIDTDKMAKAAKKGIDHAIETGKEVAKSTQEQGKKALKQGQKSAKKGIDQAVETGKEVLETVVEGAGEAVDQTRKTLSRN
jgi:hypothetical protein